MKWIRLIGELFVRTIHCYCFLVLKQKASRMRLAWMKNDRWQIRIPQAAYNLFAWLSKVTISFVSAEIHELIRILGQIWKKNRKVLGNVSIIFLHCPRFTIITLMPLTSNCDGCYIMIFNAISSMNLWKCSKLLTQRREIFLTSAVNVWE